MMPFPQLSAFSAFLVWFRFSANWSEHFWRYTSQKLRNTMGICHNMCYMGVYACIRIRHVYEKCLISCSSLDRFIPCSSLDILIALFLGDVHYSGPQSLSLWAEAELRLSTISDSTSSRAGRSGGSDSRLGFLWALGLHLENLKRCW